jgi:hypothetical protein
MISFAGDYPQPGPLHTGRVKPSTQRRRQPALHPPSVIPVVLRPSSVRIKKYSGTHDRMVAATEPRIGRRG